MPDAVAPLTSAPSSGAPLGQASIAQAPLAGSARSQAPLAQASLDAVAELLFNHPGTLVLTGAGMSTDSGIPDYRGPDGQRRVTPMQHGEFVGSSAARQRYWARSFIGCMEIGRASCRERV